MKKFRWIALLLIMSLCLVGCSEKFSTLLSKDNGDETVEQEEGSTEKKKPIRPQKPSKPTKPEKPTKETEEENGDLSDVKKPYETLYSLYEKIIKNDVRDWDLNRMSAKLANRDIEKEKMYFSLDVNGYNYYMTNTEEPERILTSYAQIVFANDGNISKLSEVLPKIKLTCETMDKAYDIDAKELIDAWKYVRENELEETEYGDNIYDYSSYEEGSDMVKIEQGMDLSIYGMSNIEYASDAITGEDLGMENGEHVSVNIIKYEEDKNMFDKVIDKADVMYQEYKKQGGGPDKSRSLEMEFYSAYSVSRGYLTITLEDQIDGKETDTRLFFVSITFQDNYWSEEDGDYVEMDNEEIKEVLADFSKLLPKEVGVSGKDLYKAFGEIKEMAYLDSGNLKEEKQLFEDKMGGVKIAYFAPMEMCRASYYFGLNTDGEFTKLDLNNYSKFSNYRVENWDFDTFP
ncbi:MAG: hypothetical protein GXZ11_02955 [Tissierellia bacterium]|nr:hypothetical protein [Tissierellia bacterium]